MKKQILVGAPIVTGRKRTGERWDKRVKQADVRGYARMKQAMAKHGQKAKKADGHREEGLMGTLPVQRQGYSGYVKGPKWTEHRGSSGN